MYRKAAEVKEVINLTNDDDHDEKA